MKEILPVLVGALGLIIGILVNYLADVLPHTRRLSKPVCWNCQHPQTWASYALIHKRCPNCNKQRPIRVWIVEGATIGIALWLWTSASNRIPLWASFPLLGFFALVMVMDIEHRIIMHSVSVGGAGLALVIGSVLRGIPETLLGGAVGFGIMFGLYKFADVFARWLAKRRGEEFDDVALGFGDVNLSGVIGLLLGWPAIVAGMVVGILVAGIYSFLYLLVLVLIKRYKPFITIPYGPFLIIGAVIILFFKKSLYF